MKVVVIVLCWLGLCGCGLLGGYVFTLMSKAVNDVPTAISVAGVRFQSPSTVINVLGRHRERFPASRLRFVFWMAFALALGFLAVGVFVAQGLLADLGRGGALREVN